MRSLVSHSPLWAAVVGAIAIVAAGCSSPGSTAKPAKPTPPVSAQQAIALAAHNAANWQSDISTTTVTGTDDGVRISFSWTLREQQGPFNESTVNYYERDGKDVLPAGGSDSVVTPTVYYIKAAAMSRYYHTSKPWVELSSAAYTALSAKLPSSGPATPGTFYGDPALGAALLTTSTDVRAVGTGSVSGVPVTEYEGSYSAASGLAYVNTLSAPHAQVAGQVTAMGLTTVRFTAWIDSQQRLRKLVLTEAGTHANLTVAQTMVSINQPANIQFPLASETYVVPGTTS